MISRKIPSGAVCLGCRLRLLSRATRPQRSLLSALDQRQRLRWFTTSPAPWSEDPELHRERDRPLSTDGRNARDRDGPDDDEPIPLHERPGHDDNGTTFRPRSQKDRPDLEDRRPSPTRRIRINKNYWTKNRLLTETATNLGTDMLGKPAYAIVMKDRGIHRKAKLPSGNTQKPDQRDELNEQEEQDELDERNEQNDQDESMDIEALLEKQRSPATIDEVKANIEELRPKSEIYLPHRKFHQIQDALEEGFLTPQLEDYIKKYKPTVELSEEAVEMEAGAEPEPSKPATAEEAKENEEDEEAEDEKEEYDAEDAITDVQMAAKGAVPRAEYPWIRGITPWVRLNSKDVTSGGLAEDTDRRLHGYVAETDSKKTKLAVRIMRECWGLQIEELMGGVGEVEVTVDKREFSLLMRGNQRFLRYISNRCLDQGESLEAFRNRTTLRIVASRLKTEAVLSQLDETLKNIKVRHFPTILVADPKQWIDPDLLEEIGRLTNTRVRQTANKRRIQVTWIETKSREDADYDVEDLRHVVFRLLYGAIRPSTALSTLWGAALPMPETKGQFLIDTANKQKWGWKDRLSTWARFVLPRGTGIASEANPPVAGDSKEPLDAVDWKEPFLKDFDEKELDSRDEEEPVSVEQGMRRSEEEDMEAFGEDDMEALDEEGEDYPAQEALDEEVNLFRLLDMPVEPQEPVAEGPQTESGLALPDVIPIVEAADMSPAEISEMEIQQRGGDHPYQPVRWSPELATTTTAFFGHVLHAKMDVPAYSYLQEHGRNLDHPRIFSPVAPHPLQLASLGLGTNMSDFPVSSSILIRFRPSTSPNPVEPMVPAPPLELRLSLTNKGPPRIAGVHSFRALVDTHIHDIMQPAKPVDLRVVQTSSSHLQGRPQDLMDWQPIWDFLRRARLELEHNKLEMPHTQKFQIPPRLFAVDHTPPPEELGRKGKALPGRRIRKARQISRILNDKIPEDPNENISVHYDFVGLELHRSVRIPHGNFDLTYTSVEAGQGSGRRAEFSLLPVARPGAPNEQAGETDQDLQKRFFEACYELAAGPLFEPRE